MTVREFLRTVWEGKWYVLAAVVIVMAAALVYLNRQVTTYQATATVQLTAAQSSSGAAGGSVTASSDPSLVTSPPVAEAAAEALGGGVSPAAIAGEVAASYSATDNTMTIQGKDAGPLRAAAVTNAFATAYVAYLPTVIDQQIAAIDKQLDALTKQLDAANAALAKDPKDPIAGPTKSAITAQIKTYTQEEVTFRSLSPAGQVTARANGAVPLGVGRDSVLAISFLAGLAAGVGLAFARRGLDFHLRSVAQAAEITGAPVLAEIDGVKRALKDAASHGRLPVASRVATPYTESIRELRTAVQVSVQLRDHVAIVVTAADPSAPRSFITANLAASLALSGRRTIAFSADMRRPELDDILPAPEDWRGDAGLRPTRVPNLSLFPVPDQPLDPADFLATAQARELVDALREQADVLIIDAPPVLAAADATILGSYSDGVVLIASVGKTDQVVLSEAVNRLRVNNVPLSGLAVEGVTGSRRMTYAATYGEAGAAAAHAVTPGAAAPAAVAPAAAESTAADAAPQVVPEADLRPAPVNGASEVPAATRPASTAAATPASSLDTTEPRRAADTPLAGPPLAAPTVAPRATPIAEPRRAPAGHRVEPGGRSGRPRIMPAWSPVSTTRPPTAATPVVRAPEAEAEADEPAAESARAEAESGQRAAS